MTVLLGLLNHVEGLMKRLVQGAIRYQEKREVDRFLSRSSRDRRMVSATSMNLCCKYTDLYSPYFVAPYSKRYMHFFKRRKYAILDHLFYTFFWLPY